MRINFVLLSLIYVLCTGIVYAGPNIQHWTQENGARVYYVEAKGLPLVDIQLVFDAGSARDGDRFGIATMTSILLDKGAGEWNVEQIAQRLEGVGARLDTSVSRDSASLSLRSLTQPRILDVALDTAAKIISDPKFDQADFEREKNRVLTAIHRQKESPAALAKMTYFNRLYGDHPYAHPSIGVDETVSALKREDILSFFNEYYVSRNTMVVIVGDVNRAQAELISEHLTAGMKAGKKPAGIPVVGYDKKQNSEFIQFSSTQTHIYSGMPALKRGDANYFALYVGNHILGGSGLVSRISEEIREKRGLAYSSHSYFSPLKQQGPFTMGLQTRNDQATQALEVLNQTLDEFIQKGPSEKELESAKKNITGGFVLRFDSNTKVADYVAMIGYYGMPLDYLDTFSDKVNAVSREQIVSAFQSQIGLDRFQTVLVGGDSKSSSEKTAN